MVPQSPLQEVIVVDLDPGDSQFLIEFGFSPTQSTSWRPGERNEAGFESLLRSCGLASTALMSQRSFGAGLKRHALPEAYFADLANDLPIPAGPRAVVLNLMPFHLSATRMDKVAKGLFLLAKKSGFRPSDVLLILVRNLDWLLKSRVFTEIHSSAQLSCSVVAVDLRCYGSEFRPGKEPRAFEVQREEAIWPLLQLEGRRIYHSLIRETNSYIGHFALPHSHVRTHYDLAEFIRYDHVWEYLLGTFNRLLGGAERLLLLGVGMELRVIQQMGEQFKAVLEPRISMTFRNLSVDPAIEEDWSNQYEMAVVVTDIVNTGNTVKPWVEKLDSSNTAKKRVAVFAVACMQNSPTEIGGVTVSAALRIKRDFYPSRQECKLCLLEQPIVKVETVEDFRRVTPEQLTPFDFWEMVKDAQALARDALDPQGRPLTYRVDTARLVSRYGSWLANVIRRRFRDHWPNITPAAICTVRGEPGAMFADLVARAIGVRKVIGIDRSDLRRVTAAGGPPGADNPLSGSLTVLLVDDGINYGHTLRSLIRFCQAAGSVVLGALVLDSRLAESEKLPIRTEMGLSPLQSLYDWPARGRRL